MGRTGAIRVNRAGSRGARSALRGSGCEGAAGKVGLVLELRTSCVTVAVSGTLLRSCGLRLSGLFSPCASACTGSKAALANKSDSVKNKPDFANCVMTVLSERYRPCKLTLDRLQPPGRRTPAPNDAPAARTALPARSTSHQPDLRDFRRRAEARRRAPIAGTPAGVNPHTSHAMQAAGEGLLKAHEKIPRIELPAVRVA